MSRGAKYFAVDTAPTLPADAFAITAVLARADDPHSVFPSVDGIGDTVIEALISFFGNRRNDDVLDALLREVHPNAYVVTVSANSQVAGKTVVFTGSLEKMTRGEAKAMAERLQELGPAEIRPKR